ncbi:uncharacterized protein Z519_08076 [Cladophialophora bantiana CBS 173.52]|uniref:GST N-terminal domain-containing protein n=1 Tax=Cladophialophora bantiana (strain ATCC 10958 / CBS 173.52 / CDC B-1940 / NIH 8579) TaxID=1442370 RepID=A0A0D2EMC8_CLAB1|nr:uncharacterized protein Z519_08076 [Cladophialophora bantiana CBS 173.52]KIW91181.1 hypothetical protein Z519_08076 [Cladophialophora bantiana CBS 173.52]
MASLAPKPLDPALMTRAELRFLTKYPDYNKLIIDSGELRRRIWLSDPQRWMTTRSQRHVGLGDLDKLPLELQLYIFATTPINSLIDLRATNSHAKQLIEQWEPFRTVMTYGPDAVRALLATEAGSLWTVPQLVDVLLTAECEFCREHGEILHLLQLKRCCFRCLSQERELLAVNLGYAQYTMKLSQAELRTLPQLVTVPQNSFWGFPAQKGHVFDYKAALNFLRRQGPREIPTRGQTKSAVDKIPLVRTGFELPADRRSVQPQLYSSIQTRRCQKPLCLLAEEVSPPETTYAQHACAVRVPALRRHSRRFLGGTLQTTVSRFEAVHCAGCAYYWNYHSSLPWQFHRLYRHQLGRVDTEFTRHLRHCVYAELQWRWIHNPWNPLPKEDIEHVLRHFRLSFLPRHSRLTFTEANALFESIPDEAVTVMGSSDTDSTAFLPQYSWPELKNGDDELANSRQQSRAIILQLERLRKLARLHPIDKRDYYWDSLLTYRTEAKQKWTTLKHIGWQLNCPDRSFTTGSPKTNYADFKDVLNKRETEVLALVIAPPGPRSIFKLELIIIKDMIAYSKETFLNPIRKLHFTIHKL